MTASEPRTPVDGPVFLAAAPGHCGTQAPAWQAQVSATLAALAHAARQRWQAHQAQRHRAGLLALADQHEPVCPGFAADLRAAVARLTDPTPPAPHNKRPWCGSPSSRRGS